MKVGPHTSALTQENVELIWDDIHYQERDGFVRIVTEEQVEEISPPNLKITSVAVVPHTHSRGADNTQPVSSRFFTVVQTKEQEATSGGGASISE